MNVIIPVILKYQGQNLIKLYFINQFLLSLFFKKIVYLWALKKLCIRGL